MNKDILKELADAALERTAVLKQKLPLSVIRQEACAMNCHTGFPFEQALKTEEMSFICECKKASPSKGLIAPEYPYVEIARAYEEAGASAISVLTEPTQFLGSLDHLTQIHEHVSLPLLRKDFTVDEYMIYEAKKAGASAVLLICAILEAEQMKDYLQICDGLGLSVLAEAHDEQEIETCLNAGARVIGVNNRNLHDFTVDIHNSIRLRKYVPDNVLFVAESGIRTRTDIEELEQGKISGVLIGEQLMRSENKKAMLEELKGAAIR